MSRYHYHLNLIFLLVSFLSFTSNFFLMVPTTPNDIRAFASFRTIIHLYYNIKTFFFSILHHHFLKISTLDYLFYVLLYSNNHFLYLFFFLSLFFSVTFLCFLSKQTTQHKITTEPNPQINPQIQLSPLSSRHQYQLFTQYPPTHQNYSWHTKQPLSSHLSNFFFFFFLICASALDKDVNDDKLHVGRGRGGEPRSFWRLNH